MIDGNFAVNAKESGVSAFHFFVMVISGIL
jgi:hypothetical protein